MQGLGSAPISLFGSDQLQSRYLPVVSAGEAVAAFAISEAGAGTDVAAISTVARLEGDRWIISGEKTWISNAPIADVLVVFARTEEVEGSKALSAFVVPSTADGLHVERLSVSGPHPIGTVTFDGVSVPSDHLIAARGEGYKVAMATLGRFRPTVGAAAVGFARRAMAEALSWVEEREIGSKKLADLDLTRERLADMALTIDAAALLVYRAAWLLDVHEGRHSRESSMAKLFATEGAQQVVDSAIQLHGARGLVSGSPLEVLYREVRALRIYEGTSEVQKLIVAREVLANGASPYESLSRTQA
jgi:acyl-CoA dehydrogenase